MPDTEELYPWGDNRRLYTLTRYIRNTFGERVQKLAIDAGFTCPHRTSRTTGGCTYCNNEAFNPSYCLPQKGVRQQIEEGIAFHTRRYRRANRYLAYFQAYSNTYAGVDQLQKLFSEALTVKEVVGLVIATRPDCLPEEVVHYLAELAQQTYIFVELGGESAHNATLKRINRGHDVQATEDAIQRLRAFNIHVGVHLIWGLPGETPAMMLDTLEWLRRQDVQSVKFHQLQILRDTAMEQDWQQHPEHYHLFSLDDYLDFLVPVIEALSPSLAVERVCAETPPRYLLAPQWGLIRNDAILQLLETRLREKNTWQGKKWVC